MIDRIYAQMLNERNRLVFERVIILLALVGFGVHLLAIGLHHLGWVTFHSERLVASPISAIYTPFSFILVYEVFMLVYYIPSSFTRSIGKQYEIITLIVVRGIFHDITELDNSDQWYTSWSNLVLAIDILAFLLLFFFSYLFHRQIDRMPALPPSTGIDSFIRIKRGLAMVLTPLLFVMLVVVLVDWGLEIQQYNAGLLEEVTDINKVFYDEFFTTLIVVDVVLLTLSLHYTSRYSQLVRNTGFVISTVLIRYSFTAGDLFNALLTVAGVALGLITLITYNHIARMESERGDTDADPAAA